MASRDQDRHLPTLAPGPSTLSASTSRQIPRPKKNSTACLGCKHAKRKCTGAPGPCKACENTQTECVFDESLDRRRKLNARRTNDELSYYRGLLFSVLELIRSSEWPKVNEVVHLIRGNNSLSNIASIITDTTLGFGEMNLDESPRLNGAEDSGLQSGLMEPQPADSVSRVSLEKLCDIPLFEITARPWTRVTNDNHLVSHLVSLFFTWVHPFLPLIDQKVVVDHLVAGSPSSEFCTPFLVNSILAVASAYSDYPEVLTVPGDINSRGRLFYMQADRLWRAEEGRITLPNIQGVILMAYFLKCQGKNRPAWLMLRQGVQLAQDFGLFQTPKVLNPLWREMPENMQHVSATTAWGVFILNSQMSMELATIANLDLPICRPYTKNQLDDDIWWTPYPRSNQIDYAKKPALFRCIMVAMADLTEIAVDIQELLFDKSVYVSQEDLWGMASEKHHRLQLWLGNLPDALKIENQPIPQVLFLHMKCHHTILSLFAPFSQYERFGQARNVQLHSAKAISQFVLMHRQSYGLKQIPNYVLEATDTCLPILLRNFDDEACQSAFVELCRILVTFSTRFEPARGIMDRIQSISEELDIAFPPDAQKLLEFAEFEPSPGP